MSLLKAFSLACAFVALAGCANLQSSRVPGADLGRIRSVYVAKLPSDSRGVDHMILQRLTAMGYTASHGVSPAPAAPVDAIVTYEDRWQWDMSMYLLKLNIRVQDGATHQLLAAGESYRPSLERKTAEEMVEEVLLAIFQKK